MIGALAIGWVLARSNTFDPGVRHEFVEMGRDVLQPGFGTVLLRAVFAGWLIALLVWMLPYAESSHFFVILLITWLIGVGHLSHVVAGAVEVFALAAAGEKSWGDALGGFVLPALMGNIIGGVTLVAALNHAQVTSGEEEEM